jgi:tRNA (guanine37-N1)-methyltransferase
MQFEIISLFPEMFAAVTESGITARAKQNGLYHCHVSNPREYTTDNHKTVDDRPYGGGPGMVMLAEPLAQAIQAAKQRLQAQGLKAHVVHLSPRGKTLSHERVMQLSQLHTQQTGLVLLASRYEGVDQRLLDTLVDEELSIGDYVLSGGELPAMVLIDAMIRQLPGALGDAESANQDSFVNGLLDYPHYTRPEQYAGLAVPEVLMSGHHEKIRQWRLQQSLLLTRAKRPDLLAARSLTKEEARLLKDAENAS